METVDRVVAEVGAAGLAATACVRVLAAGEEVVGAGFLVGPDLVATCAHVVAAATGSDAYAEATPITAMTVDFPVVPDGPLKRTAKVYRWVPIRPDGTGDVALLRLDEPAPPGAVMPPVRRVEGLWDHRFRVFGFPAGRWDGVWSTGLIRSHQATGWFQLQSTPGDQPIEGGFSGAPVWDDDSAAVVGMTVAADRDPTVTTAYLISMEHVLGLDPDLLPSPYRGLEPFGEEHAEYFFGRTGELRRLREALQDSPLVAVAGPSGVGKSSLVRAGLLPSVRVEGARVADINPRLGQPAVIELVRAILTLANPGSTEVRRTDDAERLAQALTGDPDRRTGALAELNRAIEGAGAARLVLFVDQFEEYAAAAPEAAGELLDLLGGLVGPIGPSSPLRVVLTVRGLALDELLTPALARTVGSGTVLVGPMDRAALREAIVRPSERAPGLAFEPGLIDRILDDAAAEPGQLSLVESLLAQLWQLREGGVLTVGGYQSAGGVAGALARHAEQVVESLVGQAEDLDRLRRLCCRLAVPAADGRFVRRSFPYAMLPADLRPLVARLAAGRLVVISGGNATSAGAVELAHQSLTEHWPRLRDWLTTDRDFLAWRSDLDAARLRWEVSARDDGALPRGAALAAASDWATRRPDDLSEVELDYLDRGRAARRREIRRWKVVAAAVATLVLLAGVLAVIAARGSDRITAQQATANANTLAQTAAARTGSDPLLAAELALAAWRSDPTSPAASTALANEYTALTGARAVLAGHPGGPPLSFQLRGSGPNAVLAVQDDPHHITFVTNPFAAHPTRRALSETSVVTGVLSPDGRSWGYTTADGAVRLLDLAGPAPVTAPIQLVAPGPARPIGAVFSPDSSRLAWLTAQAPGKSLVTMYDTATRATRTISVSLSGAAVNTVELTNDPDLVLARKLLTSAGSDSPLTSRSLSRDSEVRAFPARTLVANNGANTLTCAPPSDPNDPISQSVATEWDTITNAEVRRIPLLIGLRCENLWISNDDAHLIETIPLPGEQQNVWRAIDLHTGQVDQFLTPPLDTGRWERRAPVIAITSGPDGDATAAVAAGPVLLQMGGQPEPVAGTPNPPSLAIAEGGRTLVGTDTRQGHTFSSYERATTRLLAQRPSPQTGKWTLEGDKVWSLDKTAGGWGVTAYAVPGLSQTLQVALPSAAEPPELLDGVTLAFDRPTTDIRTIYALVGGVLSAFDGAAGKPLGHPIDLAATLADRAWYNTSNFVWARTGVAGQALVESHQGHLQLWDVPAAKKLLDLPIPVAGNNAVATRGNMLAARTNFGTVEVWDLETGQQLDKGIAIPDAEQLAGFNSDGFLVLSNDVSSSAAGDERIVLYDLARHLVVATLLPSAGGRITINNSSYEISGEAGLLPLQLAASADQWRTQLCGLVPDQPSPAAVALLPPGADNASPCR